MVKFARRGKRIVLESFKSNLTRFSPKRRKKKIQRVGTPKKNAIDVVFLTDSTTHNKSY